MCRLKGLKYLLVSMVLFLSVGVQAQQDIDPLESYNRKAHSFNNFLDDVAFKPLAKGYRAVTPDLIETGVRNVFGNVRDLGTMVNNVLQFKFEHAAVDLARVLFNTTAGIGGIIDVATVMGLEKHSEDLGQTLGVWGVPSGPYLVLPFFGPGSFRDSPATLIGVDAWSYVNHVPTRNVGYAIRLIDSRVQLFEFETLISGDEYIFIRDAYLGLRQQAVMDGVVDETFNDDDF
ncbi:MAG: VacJ family lipoprotein [Oceanospirillaceae bacterium]|nr:VacJ family lipoprotein [Oceanospirillaceae bacterium]